jgi:TATA-box binding protein (TBP) (component of TFIID and TFIIIB)
MIPGVSIENIIAATHLGVEFDPAELREGLGEDAVSEAPFDGLVLRQEGLRTAMLMFATGRLVSTGARDFETVEASFKDALARLKKAGVSSTRSIDVDVLNIIASGGLDQKLRLEDIAGRTKGVRVSYDPNIFEGLEMVLGETPEGTTASVLLFRSGRMVFTGTTTQRSLELAVERTAEVLANAGDGIFAKGA